MHKGRDILSEFGKDSPSPQAARATSGGVMSAKPLAYSPPQGPTNINDPKSPGIHGANHGISNGCVATLSGGSPGIGGTNHGVKGSQR